MKFSNLSNLFASATLLIASTAHEYPSIRLTRNLAPRQISIQRRKKWQAGRSDGSSDIITPKFMIISLFYPEAEAWYNIPEFNLLALNVTVPGFSPLLPNAHCTVDGEICQVVTGEGEINAASTITALTTSPLFNLTDTYFMTVGIAGVNPACGTLGTASFSKYSVQVGLEYGIDPLELASNYTSGNIPLGATAPEEYPVNIYGTEVFEISEALRDIAISAALKSKLNDSSRATEYRQKYPNAPANQSPTVVAGDVMTSDVYWHGELLGDTFNQYVSLLTNGSGNYCMTAQEDNAILESFVRAALFRLVDFSRIIILRTGANFDRPPPGETAVEQLLYVDQGGFNIALQNLYNTGINVIGEIVGGWNETYRQGVKPTNYIGDIYGSLEGPFAPDIGSDYSQIG